MRNIKDVKCLLKAKQQTVGNSGLLTETCYNFIIVFHLFNYFGEYFRKMRVMISIHYYLIINN